jgi:hypothetical protein
MKLDESTAAQIKEIHEAFCGREKERDTAVLIAVQNLSNQVQDVDSRLEKVEGMITPKTEIEKMIKGAEDGLKTEIESKFKDHKIEELEGRGLTGKTPVHKNPYFTVPTSLTGGAAIIYLVVETILKHSGAG